VLESLGRASGYVSIISPFCILTGFGKHQSSCIDVMDALKFMNFDYVLGIVNGLD